MTDRLVVVGSGIAGVSVAAGARAAGYEGEIVLLGAEDQLPYRRPPVSKEVVRGDKTADDIRIKKPQWYEDQRVELHVGTRVERIDDLADGYGGLPPTDGVRLGLAGGARIICRPSGTEAKLKCYLESPDADRLDAIAADLRAYFGI